MAAEVGVLLFNMNNCISVKEQLMSIGLENKGYGAQISSHMQILKPSTDLFKTPYSPRPTVQPDWLCALTSHSGCHAVGCEPVLLPPHCSLAPQPRGLAHLHIPPNGKSERSHYCHQVFVVEVCVYVYVCIFFIDYVYFHRHNNKTYNPMQQFASHMGWEKQFEPCSLYRLKHFLY